MPPKQIQKEWTVMVYLAGDNNLDSAGLVDLKEMKSVGSTKDVNIIAQFDRSGDEKATKCYYIRKGGTLEKDVVDRLGETNMGDPNVLKRFLQWGFSKYPAKRFLVVLWNHGAGWDDSDVYRVAKAKGLSVHRRGTALGRSSSSEQVSIRRIRTVSGKPFRRALFATTIEEAIQPGTEKRAIAFDDTSKDFLDNLECKRVLTWARDTLKRKVDILGMDACLMSMAEVYYQLRDSVQCAVGSEEVEPGDGWPYNRILSRLVEKPDLNPKELAAIIVDQYLASYSAASGVTQSACDLTKSDTLARSVDQLAKRLRAGLADAGARAAVIQARAQAQTYDTPDYIDLYDFCALLSQSSTDADIRAACAGVMRVIREDGFVLKSGAKGNAVQHSTGCAIYFPPKTVSPLYSRLDFAKDTAWPDFIEAYGSGLRRRASEFSGSDSIPAPGARAARGARK